MSIRKVLLAALCITTHGMANDIDSYEPCTCDDYLLFESGFCPYAAVDYLYWAVKQEGNNYAATGAAITVPGTVDPNTGLTPPTITNSGSVYSPRDNAKSGFRVTLGTYLPQEGWELYANYSYLNGKEKSSVGSDDLNAGILPLFAYTPNNGILASTTFYAASGATGFVSNAESSWNFQYNNINLELAKSIPLFCDFVLRPHFGLQGSWQRQDFRALYTVASTTSETTVLGNNNVLFHQNFWGVGPRLGVASAWQCFNHFGIYADSACALLWGSFKAHSSSYDTNALGGYANVLVADQIYRPTTLSPVIELSVGVSSDWMFQDNCCFVATLGWEAQVWFFQNQHSTSIPDANLILQGLKVGLRFDF